ncbi:MAG TPA: sensor domain-containing diguanylate cyclase [Armatimonadota bacterium]|nr:sensor domain-containing diguanylate cyclase [Armatimonadota bacterium]
MWKALILGPDADWMPPFAELASQAGVAIERVRSIDDVQPRATNKPRVVIIAHGLTSDRSAIDALLTTGPVHPCVLVADDDLILPPASQGRVALVPHSEANPARILSEAAALNALAVRDVADTPRTDDTPSSQRRLRLMGQAYDLALEVASHLHFDGAMAALLSGLSRLLTPARVAVFIGGRPGHPLRSVGETQASGELISRLAEPAERLLAAYPDVPDAPPATIIATPVVLGGSAVGALVADLSACPENRALYEDVLRVMAGCTANSLQNSQEHERMHQRSHHMSVLHELGRRMASITDLQEILDLIVDQASKMAGTERCSLMLLDDQTQTLRIRAAKGLPEEVIESAEVRLGEGVCGHVAATGEPLLITDIRRDPRFAPGERHECYNGPSLLSVPLKFRGSVTGVLNLSNKTDGARFSPADEELLCLLASQAAVAIENAALYRSLCELAATDGLTGLYNHQHFFSRLRGAVSLARRSGQPLAVIMIDIDHFKRVNDRFGHAQGDTVLRAVASLLRGAARKEDIAARYGGEEFAVILPNTGAQGATHLAERFRARVQELEFRRDDRSFSITVSLGIADLEPGLDPEVLLDRADQALYAAKSQGRNRTCVYEGTATAAPVAPEPEGDPIN